MAAASRSALISDLAALGLESGRERRHTRTQTHTHTQATSEQTCKTDTENTLPTHACSDIVIWFNITGVESALDHELEWNAGMDIVQNLKHYMPC